MLDQRPFSLPPKLTLMLTAAVISAALTHAGCNTSGLSGSSGGSSKAKKTEKTETSSAGSNGGGDDFGDLDEDEQSSGTAPASPSSEDPDDTRAIPPEVVSGAYLTCTAHRQDPRDQTSRLLYGCAAFDAADNRLALGAALTEVELKNNKTGDKINGTRRTPPADGRYDFLWEVLDQIDVSKIKARACIQSTADLLWIERKPVVCTSAVKSGYPNFRTCVDLETEVCVACGEGTMTWTKLPNTDAATDYTLNRIPVNTQTGLCTEPPVPLTYTVVGTTDGMVTVSFNNGATTDFCLAVDAYLPGGSTYQGGILD